MLQSAVNLLTSLILDLNKALYTLLCCLGTNSPNTNHAARLADMCGPLCIARNDVLHQLVGQRARLLEVPHVQDRLAPRLQDTMQCMSSSR